MKYVTLLLLSFLASCSTDDYNQAQNNDAGSVEIEKSNIPDYMIGEYSNGYWLPEHGKISLSEELLQIETTSYSATVDLSKHAAKYSFCKLTIKLPNGDIIELADVVKGANLIHLYVNDKYIGSYFLNYVQPAQPAQPENPEPVINQ